MKIVGKIDVSKLGLYANNLITNEVVLTEERKIHIKEKHFKDYHIIMKNIKKVILNPREIYEDYKNKDTLFFIDKLNKNNLNVVIKLNTTNDKIHTKNSIMTAWIIRDKNLNKLREKHKTIYNEE